MIRFVDIVVAESRPASKAAKAPAPQLVAADKHEPAKPKVRGRKTGS